MSLQWMLVATFLYVEVAILLMLVLPIMSPTKWQKFFNSSFAKSLSRQSSTIFYIIIVILVLLWLDSLREIYKYTNVGDRAGENSRLDAELQSNMKLFRAQRNFFIAGFSLLLSVVINRIIKLISMQALMMAQSEAALRQAQSATTTARSLLFQKPNGESAQNDSNEAHDKAVSELKRQIKELQVEKAGLEEEVEKAKKNNEALKSQAASVEKEYDRLNEEYAKLVQAGGDKKSD